MDPPKIDEEYKTTTFLGEIASYLTYSSLTNVRPEKNFLSDTQLYVGRYINKKTPYKGLLLYHGLGSGKTRASLSACTSFLEATQGVEDENKIVVMTPASLKPNFVKELQLLELYKEFIQQEEVASMKHFFKFLDEYLQIPTGDVPDKYKTEATYKLYIRDNPLVLYRYELYMLTNPFLEQCGFKTLEEFGGDAEAFEKNEKRVLKAVKFFVKKYNLGGADENNDDYNDYITFEVLEKYKQKVKAPKIKRTDFTFLSYNDGKKETIDELNLDNKVLIIDEAHNFVSLIINSLDSEKQGQFKPGELRGELMYKKIMAAKNLRIIALTGTPLINSAFEITVLINLLARKQVFPLNEQEFKKTYFDNEGQFKDRQKNHFQQKLLGYISYNAGSREEEKYPKHTTKTVRIPMSDYQYDEYIIHRIEEEGKKKNKAFQSDLDISKFRLQTRAVCDFAFPQNIDPNEDQWLEKLQDEGYLSDDGNLETYSPKMHAILKNIQKLKGKVIIFSFFRSKNGIAILEKVLEIAGITYLTWDKDKSDEILAKFNNAETNLRGKKHQVLLISKSGAEGISTKHVRQVHILEPWWHEALMSQIEGRAIRLDSHADLPAAERNVQIYRYEAVFTEEQKAATELNKKLRETQTTDEHVRSVAEKKQGEIEQVEQMMKQTAIDCLLYNPLGKEGCFYIKNPRGTGNFSVGQQKIQMTTIEIFNAENVKIPGSFTFSRDKKEMTIYSYLEPICMFDIKLTAAPENHVWLYKKAGSCRNTLIFPLDVYHLDTKTKPFQLHHPKDGAAAPPVAPSRKRLRAKTPSPTPSAKRLKTTNNSQVQPFNPKKSKQAPRKETTPIIKSDDEVVSDYNVQNSSPRALAPPPTKRQKTKSPSPSQFCKSLHIYWYKNNSCYVDSVLFSLFALPSKNISDIMTQIRDDTYLERYSKELMQRAMYLNETTYINKEERNVKDLKAYLGRIYSMMLGIYDQYQNAGGGQCGLYENLRKIKLLRSPLEIFARDPEYPFQNIGQQDANELLVIIFSHFRNPDLPKVSQQRITTYVKTPKMLKLMPQKKATKSVQTKSNIISDTIYIQLVESDDIVKFQGQITNTSEMNVREQQYKEYYNPFDKPALHRLKGQEQQNAFEENFDGYFDKFDQVDTYSVDDDQTLLIVRLERNFNHRKLQKNFLIEKELFGLQLKKIIVHEGDEKAQGGHYVVYFECGKKWYKYDDNAKSKAIEEYGNFNDIAELAETEEEIRNNVSTNCTTLFYQRS